MARRITIEPGLNGFSCKVGCHTIVFTNVDALAASIAQYYKDPERVEKQFIEQAVNKMNAMPPPQEYARDRAANFGDPCEASVASIPGAVGLRR